MVKAISLRPGSGTAARKRGFDDAEESIHARCAVASAKRVPAARQVRSAKLPSRRQSAGGEGDGDAPVQADIAEMPGSKRYLMAPSPHAGVRVHANDRQGRERLCRYVLRPPLALNRLSASAWRCYAAR
jgi:hypothetical protein